MNRAGILAEAARIVSGIGFLSVFYGGVHYERIG